MPRRSKRSLKAVAQNSEKGKGFGPVVTIIGTSPTSVVSIHYLDLLIQQIDLVLLRTAHRYEILAYYKRFLE